eukprot:6761957-Pyramimonas_sp.AAC.1
MLFKRSCVVLVGIMCNRRMSNAVHVHLNYRSIVVRAEVKRSSRAIRMQTGCRSSAVQLMLHDTHLDELRFKFGSRVGPEQSDVVSNVVRVCRVLQVVLH